MARLTILAAAFTLMLGACATAPAPPGPVVSELAPHLLTEASQLSFDFADVSTGSHYRITGPYEVIEREDGLIELESVDTLWRSRARVVVFARDEALWALARIEGREFLTRLR